MTEIARDAGMPLRTLTRLANGEVTDPRISTVERIRRYYEQQDQKESDPA